MSWVAYTTPTLQFELNEEFSNSEDIIVTFRQKSTNAKLDKKAAAPVAADGVTTFDIELTQVETGMFDEDAPVSCMINVIAPDGTRIPSETIEFPTFANLLDEVRNYGD